MKKTVLFDFDGTLADTLPLVTFCFREVFHKYNEIDLTDKQVLGMFGPTEEEILRKAVPENYAQDAINLFYELYKHHHTRLVEENESVSYMIRDLHESGYALGVCTGKGRKSMDISSSFLPFCDLFQIVVTGDEVTYPKPHPEGLLTCLRELRSSPETAVYAGDSDSDVRAGRSAGLTTIGANWLPNPQTRQFDTNPDYILTGAGEFLRLIQTI